MQPITLTSYCGKIEDGLFITYPFIYSLKKPTEFGAVLGNRYRWLKHGIYIKRYQSLGCHKVSGVPRLLWEPNEGVTSQAFHGHRALVERKRLSWFRSLCVGGYPDIWIVGGGPYMLQVGGKDYKKRSRWSSDLGGHWMEISKLACQPSRHPPRKGAERESHIPGMAYGLWMCTWPLCDGWSAGRPE